ncbi:uncharacterized protein LOC144162653 [Haemaphysalis longicornis]
MLPTLRAGLDGMSEPLRFRSRKSSRPHVTASPVLLEFGKLAVHHRSKKQTTTHPSFAGSMVAGGAEEEQRQQHEALLHAAVALYATSLGGGVQPLALYRALCAEGARTLVLLRDTQEILQEWESSSRSHAANTSPDMSPEGHDLPLSKEINNNPEETPKTERLTVAAKPWQRIVPLDRAANGGCEPLRGQGQGFEEDDAEQGNDEVDGRGDAGEEDKDDRVWIAWSARWATSAEGSADEDAVAGELTLCGGDNASTTSGRGSTCSATARDASSRADPFSDVFSDLSDSSSDMEDEEEEVTEEAGLQRFLRAVEWRRRERSRAIASWSLTARHVGPEHRLLACATFAKNYRIPGTRACFLSLLAVRKRFRQHGIGSFLLKQMKKPSVVGPYDALLVRTPASSRRFFLKHGFTDDVILSSRFREADGAGYDGSLLCYLPPFDGHYPSLPGSPEWNRPEALAAMEEEVERWKQKSLESYQCQVTCLIRLRQEVLRLHSLLQEQEQTMHALRKENCRLQSRLSRAEKTSARSLIETLEKEAADFERLCSLGLGRSSASAHSPRSAKRRNASRS